MKKALLLAALAPFILNLPAWGQEIRVTSPTAGARWCVGSSYTVTWTKSGTMDANVSIRLRLRGGGESGVVTMTDRTDNDGSFGPWEVPAGTAPGEYLVRIRTLDGAVTGSSEYFDVADCAGPAASISNVRLSGTSPYYINTPITIRWEASGITQPLKVDLIRDGGHVYPVVSALAAGTTSYSWKAGQCLGDIASPATGYRIRVSTADGLLTTESGSFELKALPAGVTTVSGSLGRTVAPRILVNRPDRGEKLCIGMTGVPIIWISPARDSGVDIGRTVSLIGVRQSNQHEYSIANLIENNNGGNQYVWTIDPSVFSEAGDYRVRVVSSSGMVSESGTFKLVNQEADLELDYINRGVSVDRLPSIGQRCYLFRVSTTLRFRNKSVAQCVQVSPEPPVIDHVGCYWIVEFQNSAGEWEHSMGSVHKPAYGTLRVGPIRRGEWTMQSVSMEFDADKDPIKEGKPHRIRFVLDRERECNDPDRDNNQKASGNLRLERY